jgi:hypothetical protein
MSPKGRKVNHQYKTNCIRRQEHVIVIAQKLRSNI